ncbi:Histone-lysine N-methyltransferase SETMAR [Ooceraea biroi]|uniref:Histone-lysine N-methyltransferase SETMAR n=1 Tax=Ooceraea biroi TaxID=2015173 RepID=A0A026VVY7_OOCBI|nr:Histone-lysine N-methyltransferase SETMAR [Ooceraea biroi]
MHFRHIMLFYFKKGKNTVQTTKQIYGSDAVVERTVQKWFTRFKRGDFNAEDQECSGRSSVDDDQIAALI